MLDRNSIRIKSAGRGPQLEVKYNNRWYVIPLSTTKQVIEPPKVLPRREKRILKKPLSTIRTITGGPDADTPVALDLTTTISLCKTTTSKGYFSLGMGKPGQMKVIVHLERLNTVDMKIVFKTANGHEIQQFVSDAAPKGLLLFCDGTYWHPITGEFSGTRDTGSWALTGSLS